MPTMLCQRWPMAYSSGRSYLNLQKIIATDALVVHLVVRVVGIAARLVFDEGEAAGLLEPGSFATGEGQLTV